MDLNQLNFDNVALRTLPIDPESGESGKWQCSINSALILVAILQTTKGVVLGGNTTLHMYISDAAGPSTSTGASP